MSVSALSRPVGRSHTGPRLHQDRPESPDIQRRRLWIVQPSSDGEDDRRSAGLELHSSDVSPLPRDQSAGSKGPLRFELDICETTTPRSEYRPGAAVELVHAA